jgi:radical SAM superfamily enzyme
MAKTHAIRVGIFLIVGAPGETPGTLRQTKSVLRRLPLDELFVNPLILLPGSRLFKEFLDKNSPAFNDYFETDKALVYPCDWSLLSKHVSPLARFFEVKPSLTT